MKTGGPLELPREGKVSLSAAQLVASDRIGAVFFGATVNGPISIESKFMSSEPGHQNLHVSI